MVAIVVLGLLYRLDGSMKRGAFDPIIPENSTWVVASSDMGATWASLEATQWWIDIHNEPGNLLREPLVSLRKKAGIRLSPERINTWMGARAVAVQHDEQWAVEFRPGLLWKMTEPFRGETSDSDPNVKFWSDFWYTDVDGLIIVATSMETIGSMTKSKMVNFVMPEEEIVTVRFKSDDTIIKAAIQVTSSLPITIEMATDLPALDERLTVPAWSEHSPMIWMAGGDLRGVSILADRLGASFLTSSDWDHSKWLHARWSNIAQGWDSLLRSYWRGGVSSNASEQQSYVSWYGVDTDHSIHIPDWGIRLDTSGFVSPPSLPDYADYHVWNDVAGWSVIRNGGARSMDVVAQNDSSLFYAEQWASMQRLVDEQKLAQSRLDKDVAIIVDWKKISDVYSDMIEKAYEHEQLGSLDSNEKEKSIEFFLKPMSHGKFLSLTGNVESGLVILEGSLNLDEPRLVTD